MGIPLPSPLALVGTAVAVLVLGGLAALLARRSTRASGLVGAGAAVAGGALGLAGAIAGLAAPGGSGWRWAGASLLGGHRAGLDPLSAVFLVPVFAVSALAAVYGAGYWRREPPARAAAGWFFLNLLTASMALVLVARDAVLFLAAWELMTLASFQLVAFDPERPGTGRAAWIYLAASQAGAACLIAMFLRLGAGQPSLDFAQFEQFAARMPGAVPAVFALGLIGFGLKAGLMPLHGWLPLAHPAAPSHVSALLSGVMIKTGIYGIARLIVLAGEPPAAFGAVLLAVGLVSGIRGVLRALGQHDLKRLLAYHSVENIGIITMGLGLGVLGRAAGLPAVAFLGWAGALFHVVNHAVFKGLLFLGAGAVLHTTGTAAIDRLGGLLKRMPWTGWTFLVGAAAIAGLPPFNGFASEFLIYGGSLRAIADARPAIALCGVAVFAALALIGGLATACFAKAFGIVFLGTPRGPEAAGAREAGPALRVPMAVLAAACVALGLGAPAVLRHLAPAAALAAGIGMPPPAAAAPVADALVPVARIGAAVLLLTLLLAGARRALLRRRTVGAGDTWDCGYARPTARMQYTAASFAQPLLDAFRIGGIAARREGVPRAFHAEPAGPHAHPAPVLRRCWDAAATAVGRHLDRLRRMQHGRLHLYVLYIGLALLVLLLAGGIE